MKNKTTVRELTLLLLLQLHQLSLCTHPSWADGEYTKQSSQMTDATIRRYYIISRIDSYIELLHRLYIKTPSLSNQAYHDISSLKLDNPFLQEAQQEIQKLHSFTPFFQLFHRYKSYHFIEDETICKDLLILTHAISNSLLESPYIDKEEKQSLTNDQPDIQELLGSSSSEIIFRFYFIKRVEALVEYLYTTIDSSVDFKKFVNETKFSHQKILECIHTMQKLNSMKLYVKLYRELECFFFLNNFAIQHEFLILTSLLAQEIKKTSNPSFNELKTLSIKDLLDYLNLLELKNDIFLDPNSSEKDYDRKTIELLLKEEYALSEIEMCNLVLRRYYFINRLSFINTYLSLQKTSSKETLTVRPLLTDWKKFERYMFLSDQLLIDSFALEIFLVADTGSKDTVSEGSPQIVNKDYSHPLADVNPLIDVDSIALRLYHIKRLEKTINRMGLFENTTLTLEDNIAFEHPVTQNCLHQIKKTRSLAPLLLLHQDFKSYFYIADELLLREYLILIAQCNICLLESFNKLDKSGKKKTLIT